VTKHPAVFFKNASSQGSVENSHELRRSRKAEKTFVANDYRVTLISHIVVETHLAALVRVDTALDSEGRFVAL